MKTAISIPDDLFRKADYLANKQGISRSQFYVMAITKFMEQGQDPITDALNDIYGENTDFDEAIEHSALADLPPESW